MSTETFATREEAFEATENTPTHENLDRSMGNVLARRFNRRDMLKGTLAAPVATLLFGPAAMLTSNGPARAAGVATTFRELEGGVDENDHVAQGFTKHVLLRWGDPITTGLDAFDPVTLTAAEQEKRFGYNNDYVAFFPLDVQGTRGLLCVNHEYTSPEVMFPGVGRPDKDDFRSMDRAKVDVEMAAHGVSVVEIARDGPKWRVLTSSPKNRRITANSVMTADGPAAGHPRLRTADDPTGLDIRGTLNNCGGGQTPWGTYLTAEENVNGYFWTEQRGGDSKRMTKGLVGVDQKRFERYGIPGNWYNWGQFHDRFNVDKAPNEPNRFGWVVEIDPSDPNSTPVKKTALGRFRHECAEVHVNKDGRVIVYSGDDAQFEYVYRYVSEERYIHGDSANNAALLSNGTLSVARFNDDGTVLWLPLVFGTGPLTPESGFASQADVLIDARLAADLLEATPMDRPEDVQVNPRTGKVYVLLTNNEKRTSSRLGKANPRPENLFGHIIEMTAPDGDHAADTFKWEILIKCGDPRVAEVGALWNPATTGNGWFASPDNVTFDLDGRMWVATDQGRNWARTGKADGLYHVETEGAARGTSRMFYRVPIGAELCGPCFTPDGESVFLAVQHPGVDGAKEWQPFGREPTFEDPPTRWPDFKAGMPPRPAVVVITKAGGGKIV